MREALAAIAAGRIEPVYLVHGDRALAEPAGMRLARALGESLRCAPRVVRRPDSLAEVIADLRTFSLFGDGKVVVVVESGVLADRGTAAALLDEIRAELPWSGGRAELSGGAREAAQRLLQVLRLHDIDPRAAAPERVLAALPEAVLAGKTRAARGRAVAGAELREALVPLLAAALEAGLRGIGEEDASQVADLLRDGLPDRQALVLVESAVAEEHPLVAALTRRHASLAAGRLAADRGGRWEGLATLAAELERETGAGIERGALAELARRTLRAEGARGAPSGAIDADSAARLAGEYRKLAALVGLAAGGRIDLAAVEESVEDRGEQDVWALLDAIGAGRAADALALLARRLAGAEDRMAERLSIFALLATYARRLVAAEGVARAAGIERGVGHFARFRDAIAARLVAPVEGVKANPLAGQKPFPLHRIYLAASRLPADRAARLPALVLATERRLKGDSGEPESALAELVLELARGGRAGAERPAQRD